VACGTWSRRLWARSGRHPPGASGSRAVLSVNAELIQVYWDIGRQIDQRQRHEGWGATVIPRLARELHNELPEKKGFSERNIKRMLAFYRAYPDPAAIVPQAVAQSPPTEKVPQAETPVAGSIEAELSELATRPLALEHDQPPVDSKSTTTQADRPVSAPKNESKRGRKK
jgi:hypothetical protein